jgi:excisionase family DNA binding protein
MDMSDFLTPEQVAERLQVKPKTIREWLRTGELVGFKLGAGWRISAADIDRYLNEQRFKVLLERAKRKHPERTWLEGQCCNCGATIPMPGRRGWACSAECKAEYDQKGIPLVGYMTDEHVSGLAEVVPPY